MKVEQIIALLQLKAHPEGGYYCETYRSEGIISKDELPAIFGGSRNYATGIYFLLTVGNFSAFHKIVQDEMWHAYLGAPVELFEITPAGKLIRTLIGTNILEGEKPQYVVKGGHWFASRALNGAVNYALAGCTVSPGFDFADFQMASRTSLLQEFPQHQAIIEELTRE